MTAPDVARCYVCRRNIAEVEKEIGKKCEFTKFEGDVYGEIDLCEVCLDVLSTMGRNMADEVVETKLKELEPVITELLSKVLMQSGKVLSGELKVEKKPEPIRVEAPLQTAKDEDDEDEEEEDEDDEEKEDD
ncbi:MAG: hypothetical protein MUP55_01010 [Candidatus Aenigmarchaeota archaeon]|nr:hypothetical protein [Candidatus Aenigmarchaeota archaeon]